jgi:hypothetical protein
MVLKTIYTYRILLINSLRAKGLAYFNFGLKLNRIHCINRGCLKIPQTVIPAKAGILPIMEKIPAYAGMTALYRVRKFETAITNSYRVRASAQIIFNQVECFPIILIV